MDTYLPGVINSLRTGSRSFVSTVLKNVKADKSEISSLISGIRDFQINNYYDPGLISQLSPLNKEYFINAFRDADIRVKNYFSVANTVGLIINSMIDVFSAEIDKVEKDIEQLEDFINNYEYISGKDDLYNSNYFEKFDNALYDYRSDGLSFNLVDRDNLNFDQNGNGFVDTKSGLFKIGNKSTTKNFSGNIESINLKSNYYLMNYSDSGFESVFTETLFDSWAVSVKSPTVLNTSLSELSKYCNYDSSAIKGAQTYVEINFSSPQLIDTLYITPNYSNGLQLLQVVLFNNSDEMVETVQSISSSNINRISLNSNNRGFIPVLSSPKIIDSVSEIVFEESVVKKVILIFNQSLYKKTETVTNDTELVSRKIYEIIKDLRNKRKNNTDKLQDLVYSMFLKNSSIKEFLKNKDYITNYYSYRYPCIGDSSNAPIYSRSLLEDLKEMGTLDNFNSSIISNIFQNFMSHVIDQQGEIFDQSTYIESSLSKGSLFNFRSVGLLPIKSSNIFNSPKVQSSSAEMISRSNQSYILDLLSEEEQDQYEYSFSLKSIEFASVERNKSNKACFVSRKIPVNGHPQAVKVKLLKDKSNLDLSNHSYDLKESTSYELSISTAEIPDEENDWIPLVSHGETSVSSEVLFIDINSKMATTRFSFKENSLSIYENGLLLDPSLYSVAARTIKFGSQIQLKPNSIYTVSYELNSEIYNYGLVDFVSSGIFQESTKPAVSSDGSGELFSSTDLTNRVVIQNIPYVNTSFVSNATYSSLVGTVFYGSGSGYNPVKILLSDGSYAVNLTNYTESSDSPDFSLKPSGVYFIQNGKEIIFNQYISSPFRVIYEYVPSSLRFRLIMRKNIPNINYTCSADSILVKCKTKIYDPFYDKLTKVIIKK
jgi:hypothetical protein